MKRLFLLSTLAMALLTGLLPVKGQGGAGTKDFPIRNFDACVNLPDFTVVTQPDAFNTVFDIPGLFSINFAEYLMPLDTLPANGDEIYNAMIALLDTVNASEYTRVPFEHYQYISAAVEFTLDGQRMFGMIYRNQNDTLFFLFADKVDDFDMLAIGRAIFAVRRGCTPIPIPVRNDYSSYPEWCELPCSELSFDLARQCAGHPRRDADRDGMACESSWN